MNNIITINLDDKSKKILDEASVRLGIPKSMVIRWLLNNFFEENKAIKKE